MRTFEGEFTPEDIERASRMFDDMCIERHNQGAEEYGPAKFLENDVMLMLAEELLDAANYCRYQFIKIILLNELLNKELSDTDKKDGDFTRPSQEKMS